MKYCAVVDRSGLILSSDIIVADSFFSRLVGLLGKKSLPHGSALWIRPCNSIHTFFMKFAIDVLFLDKDYTVVALFQNVVPWRATRIVVKAKSVLEFPVGIIFSMGLEVGDKIKIEGIPT